MTKHTRRGSSLILVMIVIASIITIVLGTQRLALVQFSQSVRQGDNAGALYGAKAGIEDGLARYRYSKNAETDSGQNPQQVERYDITTGTALGTVKQQDAITGYQPTDQYYDMMMYYRNDKVGDFTDPEQGLLVAKDTFADFSGFPNSDTPYYLRYVVKFENCNAGIPAGDDLVNIEQTRSTDPDGTTITDQSNVRKPTTGDTVDSSATGNLYIRTGTTGAESLTDTVRFRAFGCDTRINLQTVSDTTGTTPANIAFDSLTTTIISTGYYGGARKSLIATIDRRSDQLIGIYDYTLYAGTGNITKR